MRVNLLNKYCNRSSGFIHWKKYWRYYVRFIFCFWLFWGKYKWHWRVSLYSTISQRFQFEPEQKKKCGKESQLKKAKHIHASSVELLHIRIGNVNWCKCEHCKNEASKIDCLCCREVDLILIASARIPKREGSISPSSFYGQLPIICHNVLALST